MVEKFKVTKRLKGIDDAMEYEIIQIITTANSKYEKTNYNENAKYISNILSSKYGGQWSIYISPRNGTFGGYLFIEKDRLITLEIEDQRYTVWNSTSNSNK